jgi:hypothetical protein
MKTHVGSFHKKFYAPHEEIEIIVLTPERLNYLIHDKELHKKLTPDLKKVKDVFVFGCSVALRYSDLIALNKAARNKEKETALKLIDSVILDLQNFLKLQQSL